MIEYNPSQIGIDCTPTFSNAKKTSSFPFGHPLPSVHGQRPCASHPALAYDQSPHLLLSFLLSLSRVKMVCHNIHR